MLHAANAFSFDGPEMHAVNELRTNDRFPASKMNRIHDHCFSGAIDSKKNRTILRALSCPER